MDIYKDINNPPNKMCNDEDNIFTKRHLLYNGDNEIKINTKKNNEKISLRKKNRNEYLKRFRKDKLKRIELFCNINDIINYDEIIKHVPNEIISDFNNTKNKHEFYLNYLSLTDIKDPNFYIRLYVIEQIHNFVNNDITNSSLPSAELLNCIFKYLVYNYKNEHFRQKIKIQTEIIQMLIIWVSYNEEDNTNNIIYDDQFIYFLFDLLENGIYTIEFKINILILFNYMIKGINTFNKIVQNFEIIHKIEKVLEGIKEDEQYIYVFSLIDNIFEYLGDNYEEITLNSNNNKNNNKKIIPFENSYKNFILLLNNIYEKYQSRYIELKNNKIQISMDKSMRTYYKIIIKILKIINNSTFIEDNYFYLSSITSNNISLPLFFKIMETFAKEFFTSSGNVINSNTNNKNMDRIPITNNIYIQSNSSYKIREKNNLYKKFKVLIYLTHILNEIISTSQDHNKEIGNNSDLNEKLFSKFNLISYYNNLLKNLICARVCPDKNLVLRIEELIYNYCEANRNNFKVVYLNYELIRELLNININNYNQENFQILLKFIIKSLILYDTEITSSLLFNVKIVGIFIKYLEKEKKNYKNGKNRTNIAFILYALTIILDSKTYLNCKINRYLIILEFNKNNALDIILQYTIIDVDKDDYIMINNIIDYLDESNSLDEKDVDEIYNPSEI